MEITDSLYVQQNQYVVSVGSTDINPVIMKYVGPRQTKRGRTEALNNGRMKAALTTCLMLEVK